MKINNNFDVFDIVGPIMIGPSSSHTAGAVRIGLVAGQLCNYEPKAIRIGFHGSLKSTYEFHKTDVAVIAGILGIKADDEKLKDSMELANRKGIELTINTVDIKNAHPSTIIIETVDKNGQSQYIRAATIGGGNICVEQINEHNVNLDGKKDCILGKFKNKDDEKFKTIVEETFASDVIISFKDRGEESAFNIIGKTPISNESITNLKKLVDIKDVILIKSIMAGNSGKNEFFKSCTEWVEESQKKNCLMSDLVVDYEAENSGRDKSQVIEEMKQNYIVMKESIKNGLEKENLLLGNIFGGNAKKVDKFINDGKSICGISLSKSIRNALAVMEVNGSMGKVVACPTAGSAGVVPSVILTLLECNDVPEEKAIQSLFLGAGLGMIVTQKTSISGSVCGCQGECGCASAMAAGMIVEMLGGNYDQILSAFSLALGNILGLVCDPVAGLVEIPCIQRNTMGAVNAIISAEMALAGVDSVIPVDEMIGALDEVGKLMDESLKDTLGAGISNTPTARRIEKQMLKNK